MKIKDCIKGFDREISKVISPEETCKVVLRKLQNVDPPILEGYFEVQQPAKISQFRVIGTDYSQQIIQCEGSNGKGHFKEQALASGVMELVERYSCFKYLRSRNVFQISSFKTLKNNLFQLEDFYSNFINEDYVRVLKDETLESAKIRWYGGYTLNGRQAYLPIGLIIFLLEGTNGMAAGNSLEEALLHGICEVIERHCLTLIELNKLETPLIDLSTVNSPVARELINKFQPLKNQIFIKDFSLGIGLPVVGVVRKIDKNSCMITAGVATSPEEALIRALVENSQTEHKAYYKKINLSKHYFIHNKIISMKDLVNIENKNMRLELEKLKKILSKQNMKIFFFDTTDKTLNIPSIIVYITGAKFISFSKNNPPNVLRGIIEECLEIENYMGAKRYVNVGKDIDKKNRNIYIYYKGVILMRENNYQQAIRYFQQALNKVEIGEIKKYSLINLGLCYQAMNGIDNAINNFLIAIDLYPEFRIGYSKDYYNGKLFKLFKNSKLLLMDRNLYQEFISVRKQSPRAMSQNFKKIFEKYQNDKKTILDYLNKTKIYFFSKRYKAAIRKANKVIQLNYMAGEMLNLHLLLGFCYEKIKQYKKAINELKKAKKINSEEAQINFSLSNCYRKIGQTEQANKELEKGLLKFKKFKQERTS